MKMKRFVLNALEFVHSAFVLDVTRVQRSGWLKEQNPTFLLGHGTVFDPVRHYDKLAGFDPFVPVAEFHAEAAFDDQEHFVFVIVMVEDERAVELDELHVLSVEFGGDAGLVVVVNFSELLGDVDLGHGISFEAWRFPPLQWMTLCGRWSQENSLTAEKTADLCSAWTSESARPYASKGISRQLFADG